MLTDRIKKLTPYVPGEQPQDRRYIKLNTNENPYPRPRKSRRISSPLILKSSDAIRIPLFGTLRTAIAKRYGIDKAQVFVGNGSDEVLAFAFYAFFDSARGNLLFPEFSYSFYPVYCDFYGIQYQKIPLKADFTIDIGDYVKDPSCGIVFPNPNAPTGVLMSLDAVTALMAQYPRNRVVVVDEAYIDFGGESAVSLIDRFQNLIVIRTFSKSMSLAALRLGFAMGDEKLVNALFSVKDSFNSYPADLLAQQIGEIAIRDTAYYDEIIRKIIQSREYLSKTLRDMGWEVLPSGANFILAGKSGLTGKRIYTRLKENGILVRYFHIEGIKEFVRITIGTDEEIRALIEAIERLF
ncbi:MAG: histidinol-phosphate transaminase [Deltaproteobacteria bacterium]|nr:histidinol-phosphate transaminase [Deltaproteobacteria bacterium]